jgi:hypothetical protein
VAQKKNTEWSQRQYRPLFGGHLLAGTHSGLCAGVRTASQSSVRYRQGMKMNWDRIEGNWKQFKGNARQQWAS